MNTDEEHQRRLAKGADYYRRSSRLTIFNDRNNSECKPTTFSGGLTSRKPNTMIKYIENYLGSVQA